MARAGIISAAAVLLFHAFTSVSGDETDPLKNLGKAISQVAGGGDWLRPGQPVLIWPLDESALPALIDGLPKVQPPPPLTPAGHEKPQVLPPSPNRGKNTTKGMPSSAYDPDCIFDQTVDNNTRYHGNDVNNGTADRQPDAQSCQLFCRSLADPRAHFFTYNIHTKGCWCKNSKTGSISYDGLVSGRTICKFQDLEATPTKGPKTPRNPETGGDEENDTHDYRWPTRSPIPGDNGDSKSYPSNPNSGDPQAQSSVPTPGPDLEVINEDEQDTVWPTRAPAPELEAQTATSSRPESGEDYVDTWETDPGGQESMTDFLSYYDDYYDYDTRTNSRIQQPKINNPWMRRRMLRRSLKKLDDKKGI